MSASSKKKLRKEQEAVKMTEQQLSAQKEAKKLNLYTIIFVAVMAVLLVVAVTVGISRGIANSGIREKNTTALVVGEHELSNAELNYFYIDAINNFYSQYGSYAALFGLDGTKPLDEQVTDEEAGTTWADDFLNTAKNDARDAYALADAAKAAGFALTEEQQTSLDLSIQNMEAFGKLYGYPNGDAYLKAIYGAGASKETFKAYSELKTLASAFYADYAANLSYEDADLRAVDGEKYENYSSFSYNTYYLSANSFLVGGTTDEEGNTTYTDEQKATAVAAAEEAAKALTSEEIDSAEALDAAIAALSINEDKEVSSNEKKNVLFTSVDKLYADWLAEEGRQEGDLAYFASTSTDSEGNETVNGYQVVRFTSSNDNTFALPNVRHILAGFNGGVKDETTGKTVYSDEEKAAAKAEAEELLAQWQAGEANEDSFAALANEKSDDGNGTTGGLYENIAPGMMVAPFDAWCYGEGRKAGDTGIVETEFGYHVMYFAGYSEQNYRDFMIENELRSADSKAWFTETVEAVTMTDGDAKYIPTDLILNRG